MKNNRLSVLAISVSLLFIGVAFAQDTAQEAAATTPPASQEITIPQNPATIMPPSESETQWIWGEVVLMDPAAKSLTIKYLDYETDQEKEMVIGVDEKTSYENIKSIDEIKLKDILSIDYISGAEGKNTAKNISLEKPESAPAPQEASSEEISPEKMQPESPPQPEPEQQ